jgi:hypothetical protein
VDLAAALVIDGGYFARRVMPKPHSLSAAAVREICSVSECMSPGADGWIRRWRHNGLGWFNSVADAVGVIPDGQHAHYRLFAYRIHPEVFRAGRRLSFAPPADVKPEPMPDGFQRLGFDSASKSSELTLCLECSPLSCNEMAMEMSANAHCLFETLGEAIAGAQRFAVEQPEPGDYFVVEVLEAPGWRIDPS